MAVFVFLHLINHALSIFGPEAHLAFMDWIRPLYRNIVGETLLVAAAVTQIISGVQLLWLMRKRSVLGWFDRLRMLSGVVLGLFLIVHLTAVFSFRYGQGIDTNFHFVAPGYNVYPATLFFIPYYSLAVVAFFVHLSAVHYLKIQQYVAVQQARKQAQWGIVAGVLVAIIILLGFTDFLQGREAQNPFEKKISISK